MRSRVVIMLVMSCSAGVGVAVAAAGTRAEPGQTTTTFTGKDAEQTLTVPPDVRAITVTATGAPGQSRNVAGGAGSVAGGVVAVSPGQRVFVEVGGTGVAGGGSAETGFNGGGAAADAGGAGGGASDVRSIARDVSGTLASRWVTAAGGGGAAGNLEGGAGDADGPSRPGRCTGGGRGTMTTGGAAGTTSPRYAEGATGKEGAGADATFSAGAGGGGLFGGGSGGTGAKVSTSEVEPSCGGGGGGSGFAAGVGAKSVTTAARGTVPSIVLSWTPTAPAETTTAASTVASDPGPATLPTPAPPPAALSGLTLPRKERGKQVVATVQVGQDRSILKATLTVKQRRKQVRVGKLTVAPINAGPRALTLKLDAAGRKALTAQGKLALVLAVTVTPPAGDPVTLVRKLTLRR